MIAKLEHPGIVPIHDAGFLSDGRVFYAMKYVRGRRLDDHAADASFTEVLRIFQRICETVAFAHSHGVIHCDLKPDNIMVGSFGEVLVLDWGVAKIIGAPGGEETDVYALGRMLAKLTAGRAAPRRLNAIAAFRYATAMEISDDIERYLSNEPVAAYRETLPERAARLLARHRILVALITAYLAMRALLFFFTNR